VQSHLQVVDDLAMSGQGNKCRLLISPNEAAVAVDVGAEDSGEPAFHTHLSPHHPVGCNNCQISKGEEARYLELGSVRLLKNDLDRPIRQRLGRVC
jgi:hypothetical protein